MVLLMLMSTQMYNFQDFERDDPEESDWGTVPQRTAYQQMNQASGPMSGGTQGQPASEFVFNQISFTDPSFHDPASFFGKVSDPAALNLDPGYGFFLEETQTEDHDNDGIDDLNDLDDDNDGINDLIERFDGCYGTDPFDHDNDGILDEFDWDDDNDGIIEGPIDYTQGADPKNVSADRYVEPSTVHPWTGTPVGTGYRVDQNPMDHDNDGITDDATDGTGRGSYDEDDDNDGRIDQFTWPCDFDGDGLQDYFDLDDDGDGVNDIWDEHPWDSTKTGNITATAPLWSGWVEWTAGATTHNVNIVSGGYTPSTLSIKTGDTVVWTNTDTVDHTVTSMPTYDSTTIMPGGTWSYTFNSTGTYNYSCMFHQTMTGQVVVTSSGTTTTNTYSQFVGGVDYVQRETLWHPRNQSFDMIIDGDLDGDGIPNFIDPDNDNDGTPDSADTDDDNDGLMDMYDVDDDNDGLPDTCHQIDTNNDGVGDYPIPYTVIEIPGIDCELDYDRDLDDDRYRPIDQDYDLVWDWLDPDMGGTPIPDNPLSPFPNNIPFDLDDDGLKNELEPFMNSTWADVQGWNCPSVDNPNPVNPHENCVLMRKSYTGNNDWDGDGINNWEDVDDDNDGILDWLDIDPNCDLDDDNDLHLLNGSMYRDDGPNSLDTDIDGDGLPNDYDWDDDNDGIPDFYDPDDGNCGIVDSDNTDPFNSQYYSHSDGDAIDGSDDGDIYAHDIAHFYYWNQTWMFNPFNLGNSFVLDYNGYINDGANGTLATGKIPEMYWYVINKWSPYNGGNYFDIDLDGDSLVNGIDVDQDGDGLPDWWDQDEGNDGVLDVNDPKMGGSFDDGTCGSTLFWARVQNQVAEHACGLAYAWLYGYPLQSATRTQQMIYTMPYSTRPDPQWDDGAYNGSNSQGQWTCNKNCFWFDFFGNQDIGPSSAVTYNQMKDNRDLWIAYVGINFGFFSWNTDSNGNMFPDEDADLLNNDVDPDDDCGAPVAGNMNPQCMFNDTADLDDDFDAIYDHWDIDDDNDGIWDYFEVDTNDDLDDDANTEPEGAFFIGFNCEDNDDDGTDTDPDEDGWYQAVWDKGVLGQALLHPKYYDVDNDNDGVPDGEDPDDDNNGLTDDQQELLCFVGEEQSTWDHDNECILDEDDKIPTRISLTVPPVLWLDNRYAARFNGTVNWLDPTQGVFAPAPDLPVQVHIVWTRNGTSAIESIDVLTNQDGDFVVGQFLFPEDIHVGDNTTYNVYAEVTEMFIHDGSSTEPVPVEIRANTTIDYVSWSYFRSDEQPLFVDYKVHYAADWERGIFGNRLTHAPVSFTISGGIFGNTTHPTVFDGYGYGYRADSGGWVSLTFVQASGTQGAWKQVQWNSTMDNGAGKVPGGYEEIVWDDFSKSHNVIGRYNYTNTSLPIGDYAFVGYSRPDLGSEWPWPFLEGDNTDSFAIRSMHRMYVEATIITPSIRPVYFWDSTQFTGSSFGAWRAMFHGPSLVNAGLGYSDVSLGKPYPMLWDGSPGGLTGQAASLRPFLSSNGTHWFISMQNGGDFNVPPCGPVDPLDPGSEVRCEVVPEMFTGEKFRVIGTVWNRTMTAWPYDPMALQVDVDHNGVFAGSSETGYARVPQMVNGEAQFDYNWTWYSQYAAGVFGIRADFTNSNYYFTGNQTSVLAPTGAYANVSVIGTTDFQLNNIPRLYRGQNTTIEARLIDNAYQPVRDAPINYTWSADGTNDIAITDHNGVFAVNLTIGELHDLGNFTLSYSYPGDPFRHGSSSEVYLWVVSRTLISLQSATSGAMSSGDTWEFSAQVTDDNRTPNPTVFDPGQALDGCGDNGGEVLIIFEGTDFEDRTHRQIVEATCPSAGSIHHDITLDPQLLRDDPESFLPDGFGPVNVILRFGENLPHEGCEPLEADMLRTSGAWDPCAQIVNSEHYRKVLQFNIQGFYLVGRTNLVVDDQIVYTSEIDPNTGQPIEKPMIVTGQLLDELGGNLSFRAIRIEYQMINMDMGSQVCIPGTTDADGFFEIICPLTGVEAGQAMVTISYDPYESLDNWRYKASNITKIFPVFSNSTMLVQEVGPFRTDVDTYTFANGSTFPVLYLKESFHIDALLTQTNGNPIGGKCLNIYLDPLTNTRPIATATTTDGIGEIKWFSGDPEDNPSRRGVEPNGEQLEGFRTVRVAYEPGKELPGGCRAETTPVVNGSSMDIEVLVRSRVDILLKDHWASSVGYQPGDQITGAVAILRDRLDLSVGGETVIFTFQYWNGTGWVTNDVEYAVTNEQGSANFTYEYRGEDVGGEIKCAAGGPCAESGRWRVLVHFQESSFFQEEFLNSTPIIFLGEEIVQERASWFTARVLIVLGVALAFASLIGAIMYRNYAERRRIEIIRGILTDSLMSLKASNDYIQTIFNCYKDLVRFFRTRGAMKKVYETTREFEDAITSMLGGVAPPEDLNELFSIFEEARYSDHEIGADQRDRAIAALQGIVNSLTAALGDSMLSRSNIDESTLYGTVTKAGEFVDAEGETRIAGIDEDTPDDGFRI